MRSELIKQFTKKMIKKTVIFIVLMVVLTAIGQSVSPVISNNMALTQMQNSNEMYMLMNTYNKVRPIINLVYVFIVSYFIGNISRDIYKFVKMVSEEGTEN
jgi:hypothetical protein